MFSITLFASGFIALQGKRKAALFLIFAVGGGMLLSLALKHGFSRPRPDLVPHASIVHTMSFPSGHSMMSATTYLTLAAILWRTQRRRRLKLYLFAAALLLTILVGFSRVYLGVHWPTDVLAGWFAGAAWACCAWLGARWLQLFGGIEAASPP